MTYSAWKVAWRDSRKRPTQRYKTHKHICSHHRLLEIVSCKRGHTAHLAECKPSHFSSRMCAERVKVGLRSQVCLAKEGKGCNRGAYQRSSDSLKDQHTASFVKNPRRLFKSYPINLMLGNQGRALSPRPTPNVVAKSRSIRGPMRT